MLSVSSARIAHSQTLSHYASIKSFSIRALHQALHWMRLVSFRPDHRIPLSHANNTTNRSMLLGDQTFHFSPFHLDDDVRLGAFSRFRIQSVPFM